MELGLVLSTRSQCLSEECHLFESIVSSDWGVNLGYFFGPILTSRSSPVSSPLFGLSPELILAVLACVLLCTAAFLGGIRVVAHSQTSLGKILLLAVPERYVLTGATVCMLFQTVCQMPLMWVFGQFIDVVTEHLASGASSLPMQKLELMMSFLVAAIVCGSVLGALSSFLFSLAGERITRRLRADFFRSLLIQDMAFFDTHQSGEWLNRLAADAGSIQAAASTNLALFLNNLAQFSGGVLICLAISWKLFLIIFVVMPVMITIAIYSGRMLKRLSKKYQSSLAVAGGIAGETFGNMRTIRTFANGEARQLEDYVKELDAAFFLGRRRARIGAFLGVTMGLLIQLSIVGALAVGGMMVVKGIHHKKGGMPAGSLTSFLMYALWAAGAVGGLVGLYNSMSQAIGASHRVFEVVERQPAIPSTLCRSAEDLLRPSDCYGAVSFEDVHFAYSAMQPDTSRPQGARAGRSELRRSGGVVEGRGAASIPLRPAEVAEVPLELEARVDVLRGVSFSVQPGSVAALVGPSGGGKSTIIALISRLYDPREGMVCLDGRDLKTLDPRWLRKQMGVVSQEPVLFSRSIRDNITYGIDRPASDAEVEAVARKANAHSFISKLSEGYDALCGERGVRLSGGEKQRVAIARALLLQPRLLLMDEATSALDAESEHLVQEAMDLLLHQAADRPTVFMIAHRLSTVQSASVILVIKDGRVEEQGTHADLLRQNGLYARLAMHQRLDRQPSPESLST